MSNPYFTFATPLTPGTRGRAGELNDLFLAVEAGFDAIPAVGSAPFGTPTVKVGLAPFAQGVANFVLRSDAKLVLDEAITPTWTGLHKHTHISGIEIENTSPLFLLDETDAPANERQWRMVASGGNLFWSTRNDLGGGDVDFMVVTRTGTTVDSIALTSTALTWNGSALLTSASLSGYAQLASANVFTANQRISSATPQFFLNETDATADNRLWVCVAEAEKLRFGAENDASTVTTNWLTVDRTGTTVDAIALASTALTWNGNTLFSTANDGAGSGLDADLLDGVQGAGYAQLAVTNTFTLAQRIVTVGPAIHLKDTAAGTDLKEFAWQSDAGRMRLVTYSDAGSGLSAPIDITRNAAGALTSIALTSTAFTWNGNTIFTTANDGAGSGLDADLLDGQSSAFYQSASNLNAGTLPDARFPATLPAASGVNLTALNAANLASGAVPAARMPAHTGDVTSSAGAVALTIANDAVTYAKMQNVSATSRILGRITAAAGDAEELTAANVKTILALAAGDISGLAAIATSGSASDLGSGTIPSARVTSVDAACTINAFVLGYVDVPRRTSGFAKGECMAVSAGQTLNTSDMATSRCFSLYNDSASTITLTQGAGVTLRKHGTATTGNLTVAIRGMVTIWCNSGTEAIAIGDVS